MVPNKNFALFFYTLIPSIDDRQYYAQLLAAETPGGGGGKSAASAAAAAALLSDLGVHLRPPTPAAATPSIFVPTHRIFTDPTLDLRKSRLQHPAVSAASSAGPSRLFFFFFFLFTVAVAFRFLFQPLSPVHFLLVSNLSLVISSTPIVEFPPNFDVIMRHNSLRNRFPLRKPCFLEHIIVTSLKCECFPFDRHTGGAIPAAHSKTAVIQSKPPWAPTTTASASASASGSASSSSAPVPAPAPAPAPATPTTTSTTTTTTPATPSTPASQAGPPPLTPLTPRSHQHSSPAPSVSLHRSITTPPAQQVRPLLRYVTTGFGPSLSLDFHLLLLSLYSRLESEHDSIYEAEMGSPSSLC